ncbi:MAG: gamma-glutamyltransferase, partial [Myxococcota bacterium]|nr:gamma-glutamyltransferase [Myxococcota bacterium]
CQRRSMLVIRQLAPVVALALCAWLSPPAEGAWRHPAEAHHGMVASANPHATVAGRAMLAAGGNAVDAAVAVSLGLSVTEPWSSGLGGGGFMIVHMDGESVAWDFREMAPAGATRDMFVKGGKVVRGSSTWSALASGIPGQVRGLVAVHRAHGRLPFAVVAAPAISLARDGFQVSGHFRRKTSRASLHFDAEARRIFLDASGRPWPVGTRFRQPELAATLEAIVETDGEAFYTGEVAREMVRGVREAGGLWTMADLAGYEVKRREVVRGTYRGYDIASMSPPSSGGVLLVQMLGVLEGFDLKAHGYGSAWTVHRMVEAMKRAYAMRAKGLGDPDHHPVKNSDYMSAEVIAAVRREVRAASKATPSAKISRVKVRPEEGTHTSHFGVLMANGDAVACTQTINLLYGSGRMAGRTGVVLNNEMDDFSAMPGVPNAFGLIGDVANAVAPGKRPLSSMTPSILSKDGRAVGVFGTPGGSTIITTTLQSILNVVDHGMDVSAAVGAPRVHHQWYPEQLMIERDALSPDTRRALRELGHQLAERGAYGNAMALWRRDDGVLTGAADPRGEGTAGGIGDVPRDGLTRPAP